MKNDKKPKIRFKGFDDDWEQHKLSDVVDVYDGVHQTPEYKDEGIMFLSVENISTLKSEKYISEEAFERDYKIYPKKGDILMTRIGDIGTPNVVETTEKVAFYVSLALLKPHGIDSYFLNNAIQSKSFQKGLRERSLLTAIPMKINKDEIGKVDVYIPKNIDEQKKIGKAFKQLDNLITLHQRKCDKLQKIKKSMLEKMFPQNESKKPEIRFKGLNVDWEQRKLSEVVKEIKRTDETSSAPVMMITAENGFINQSERYSTNNAGQSLKKYILLEKGELAYNHGASKLRPFGSCFSLTTEEKARIPFVYHCFSSGSENAEFMSIELNGKAVESQLRRIVSSGARMDGLLNISFQEYTSIPILLPEKAEQDKIADYFCSLDHLITLHQRELEKMKYIKKSMLEKMFV